MRVRGLEDLYPGAAGDLDNSNIQKSINSGHKGSENLKPMTKENSRERQLKGAAARKANHKLRQELKLSIKEFDMFKNEVFVDMESDAVDFIRMMMLKAMNAGDYDTAADLAKSIAEYDRPKLARIETTNKNIDYSNASDEDIKALEDGVITEGEFHLRLVNK